MNVITIELCAEDRARLDKVIELLGGLRQPDCSSCGKGVADYMDRAAAVMDGRAAVAAADPVPAVEPVKVPEPSAPAVVDPEPVKAAPAPISLAEFQKALTLRCAESAEMKARVRALLNEYAPAASAVPEEKRSEILARLAAL